MKTTCIQEYAPPLENATVLGDTGRTFLSHHIGGFIDSIKSCFISVACLSFVMIFATTMGKAQLASFTDLGTPAAALAFVSEDDEYGVTFEVVDFVFESNDHYFPWANVSPGTFAPYSGVGPCGYWTDGDMIPPLTGMPGLSNDYGHIWAGKYRVTISDNTTPGVTPKVFYLNLTDWKWLHNTGLSRHSLIFDVYLVNNVIHVNERVSLANGAGVSPWDYCASSTFDDQKYWEQVHYSSGGSAYVRGRDRFILDAGSYPDNARYPANTDWTIDFSVLVTGNIDVPLNTTLHIKNDDYYYGYYPYGMQTHLRFEPNVFFTIFGTLITNPSYLVFMTPEIGMAQWGGLRFMSPQMVYLTQTEISNAVTGIYMDNCTNAGLVFPDATVRMIGCMIDSCSNSGMHLLNSDPSVWFSSMYLNTNEGAYVEGDSYISKPYFEGCSFDSNMPVPGATSAGDGLYGYNNSYMTAWNCDFSGNTNAGIRISGGSKARIYGATINNNLLGLYMDNNGITDLAMNTIWTTLQNSVIRNNSAAGIRVSNSALLRGWFSDPEPAVGSEWAVQDSIGNNCIRNNETNIEVIGASAGGTCQIDLGRKYYDGATLHVQGGENDITDPVSWQCYLINTCDVSVNDNYWGNWNPCFILPPAIIDASNYRVAPVACAFGKASNLASKLPQTLAETFRNMSMEYVPHIPVCTQLKNAAKRTIEQKEIKSVTNENGFVLGEAYPNPFNGVTRISFTLPENSLITLNVFDLLGRRVACIAQGEYGKGVHTAEFNGAGLPTGLYICVLQTGSTTLTRKMTITR